jgi:hypothetical protein
MDAGMIDTAAVLTGSDKQVAWATEIRAKLVGDWNDHLIRGRSEYAGRPELAEIEANAAKIAAVLNAKTDARFWIDARHHTQRSFADALLDGKIK